MTDNDDITTFVLGYLKDKNPDLDIGDGKVMDRDYFADKLVDSLGALEFIAGLEEEFGIEFSFDDFANPNFKVVGGLVDMVRDKREAAA